MIFVLALVLVQAAGLPDVKACGVLVMTTPRDEWRLTVMPDGSARVNYAALPQTVEVPAKTFDFGEIHSALEKRTRATGARGTSGTAECRSFRGEVQGTTLPFDDDRFAAMELERAWARALPPSNAIEQENFELLRGMWNRRQRPR